jgi:hypothetical protein
MPDGEPDEYWVASEEKARRAEALAARNSASTSNPAVRL